MPREFSEWEWDAESGPEGLWQAEQAAMAQARENEAWVAAQCNQIYSFDGGWFVECRPFHEHSAFGNSLEPRAWRGWELRASYDLEVPAECWDFLGRIERDEPPTREEAQVRLEDFLANCE